jgi:hypothetical protein
MSFSAVRTYFRSNLSALGFTEWKDAFNVENIPSTRLERAFHISAVDGARRPPYGQQSQEVDASVAIRIFRKGYRQPADAVDQAILDLEAVLARVLDPTRRLGAVVKNVYYNSHTITELSSTNDNVAVLEINFDCLIILCT